MGLYFDKLKEAMEYLASNYDTIFMGQAVSYKGTGITGQLANINLCKKLELPVAEELQAGMALGMALRNYVPVCIYPRWNFALLAANQIINHLDKWPKMTNGVSWPKVIIKVAVGSVTPLDPGFQHKADFTDAFEKMCETITVVKLLNAEQILPAYKSAYARRGSTILVEYGDLYNA